MVKKELLKPGQRIEGTRLTVIKEVEPRGTNRYFLCQCDCGSEPKEIQWNALRSGTTKSCGCLHSEIVKNRVFSEETKEKMTKFQRETKYKRKARSDSVTGFNGVSYSKKRNIYSAYIYVNGKKYVGGEFETLEGAVEARKKLEAKYANK